MSASRRGSVAIPRSNRRERHRLETHDKLYRSALELFGERGFLETTVEDITEAADVGKGTFFNYFRTKEHVLAAYGGERIAPWNARSKKRVRGNTPVLDVLGELAEDSSGAVARESGGAASDLRGTCVLRAGARRTSETDADQPRTACRHYFAGTETRRSAARRAGDRTRADDPDGCDRNDDGVGLDPNTPFQTTARQIWDLICQKPARRWN